MTRRWTHPSLLTLLSPIHPSQSSSGIKAFFFIRNTEHFVLRRWYFVRGSEELDSKLLDLREHSQGSEWTVATQLHIQEDGLGWWEGDQAGKLIPDFQHLYFQQ